MGKSWMVLLNIQRGKPGNNSERFPKEGEPSAQAKAVQYPNKQKHNGLLHHPPLNSKETILL